MTTPTLSLRQIAQAWWHLVISALLDALEVPMQLAVLARLGQPEINLAAYGGLVHTLTTTIAAPASFLLPTAIALGQNEDSRRKLRRFALMLGGLLTFVHALIAFTPLYSFVVVRVIGVPDRVAGPAQVGMMAMVPWSLTIAYRCLTQGFLIHEGRAQEVKNGVLVRLGIEGLVFLGVVLGNRDGGIVVITTAALAGASGEVVYLAMRVRSPDRVEPAPSVKSALTWSGLLAFYVPLALTELISVPVHPLRSAALSRMALPVASLAVYPIVYNLVVLFVSASRAFHDVVVALLDRPRALSLLRRFALLLAGAVSLLLLVIAITPLSTFIFSRMAMLPPPLVRLAQKGLWMALPYPGLLVFHSLFQGILVYTRFTRGIPEGLIVYLLVSTLILGLGAMRARAVGLYVVLISIQIGFLAETAWMWWRGRPALLSISGLEQM